MLNALPLRRIVFGIGSNLGDRVQYVTGGIEALLKQLQAIDPRFSRLYETSPVGGPAQPNYVNAAVSFATDRCAYELLRCALAIEKSFGRKRSVRFGPRTLDIDLLWIDNEQIHTAKLQVPHPRLMQRAFALCPMADVEPNARDPRTGKLIADALTSGTVSTNGIWELNTQRPLQAML